MAEQTTQMAPREQQMARRQSSALPSPFRMLERFADEIDGVFDDFGLGRNWLRMPARTTQLWAPDIEITQQKNELVVRADLPGMKKEDVCIDVTDNDITISGERRQEEESERGGMYRSERMYGSFMRTIPLPDGAMADQAKATFKNGVLEIRMPAPPEQVTRGRRLEIQEGAASPTPPKK
ncbi:MAG TPA: Hsp20/alpha crystallin family protein [Vicinamibacterales bacterium]|nr:Hsp20/alpha crystallin family protein [Vicinamibacterales bacterium]